MSSTAARVPDTPGLRDLGPVTWLFCKIAARAQRVRQVHLFTTLGQHPRLIWAWLPFGGVLLNGGRLPKRDTELVILRVAQLRGSQYELQHHRRIARRAGLDEAVQQRIFAGADADGLTDRQRALLTAVDEVVRTRTLSDPTWQMLSAHLDRRQLIEFVMLATQYDALAATLSALRVPSDY